MEHLDLNIFITSADDAELAEYKLLAALKNYKEEFHKYRLYPFFGEIVEVSNQLHQLINSKEEFNKLRSKKITGIDLENQQLIYEYTEENLSEEKISRVFSFIEWALPKIKETLEEGAAVYDFVENNIEIKEIGLLPIYKDEGYFFVRDNQERMLYIYKFSMAKVVNSNVPFQSLKTNFLEAFKEEATVVPPEAIKLELIKKYPDLPNPATYNLDTDVDFPFNETVLPVAKRKFIRFLAA
ncbi:hypothetical protein ACSSWA_05525 [Melioribacter sp. Ez-97]|uniref:hypothetical protein n=1 Tax=Melioribacter sp. Ez-97 TaxID=3423434 RepID=UPI003ED91FFA